MLDIRVRGAEDLALVARLVKEAGDKDLRKELFRSLNSAVKPLREDVKRHIPDYMPDRYAALLAPKFKTTARRRTSQRNPALYLIGSAKTAGGSRNVGALNRGALRHPLFGNRHHWFATPIKPGFWTEPLEAGAPKVRREIVEALHRIALKITTR